MAKMYLKLILAGRKSFSDVPEKYKLEVKKLLSESGNFTAKKNLESD